MASVVVDPTAPLKTTPVKSINSSEPISTDPTCAVAVTPDGDAIGIW